MFGLLENLTKAVVAVAVTPVDVVADVVTMGGMTTDQDKPYTQQRLEQAAKALNKALETE